MWHHSVPPLLVCHVALDALRVCTHGRWRAIDRILLGVFWPLMGLALCCLYLNHTHPILVQLLIGINVVHLIIGLRDGLEMSNE